MKRFLLQLALLIVWCQIIITAAKEDAEKEKQKEECPPKGIKSVPVDTDKLLSGEWTYVRCTPSVFCDHLTCFNHKFDREDYMLYTISSSAYNLSSHSKWHADGICKANAMEGKVDYKGEDSLQEYRFKNRRQECWLWHVEPPRRKTLCRANGEYYMLGTDYEHWWLLFCCLPDYYGVKKPAAWVASRDLKLTPSAIAAAKKCAEDNGLSWSDFHRITDKSCKKYHEDREDD